MPQIIHDGVIENTVIGKDNPATGNFTTISAQTGLMALDGTVEPIAATLTARKNRKIKHFSDLLGVTITTSNATVVSTIDTASPFGCPALKLVITFSTTAGRVEVQPPATNIPAFNGHVAYSMWLDDPTKLGETSTFIGTTGYAAYQQAKLIVFNGGDLVGGPRVIVGGPIRKNNISDGGFVFGTNPLQNTKIRFTAPNPIGGTCTVWLKECFIPAPQRPLICFSLDDGFDSMVTKVLPILAKYGIKATFGINTDQINKGATGITSANLQALIAAGHHISSHNVFNYKLQTLSGTGGGESNGSGTSQDAASYVADFHTAKAILESYGADPAGFMYHPWVQGGMDQAGAEAMWASGVDIIRTTSPYEAQMYGFDQWNNALAIRSVALDNTRTIAQNIAAIDDAINYGGLVMFMGHETNDTSNAAAVTWLTADLETLVAYAAAKAKAGLADILTAQGLRDRFALLGILRSRNGANNPNPVRCIGTLLAANMNSTSDQGITLNAGQWKIEGVYFTKASTSLTTAAGGVYTTTAKGGTAAVASSQAYTTLVAATDVLPATMAATPTVTGGANALYLSLTTGQGAAATADVFVFGRPI